MSPPANSPGNPIPASPIQVTYHLFAALNATLPPDEQSGLGGRLLYAGAVGTQSSYLLYAANIAGAASLAAAPAPVLQRQAIRDGVIDFLVTSLEEALRILKNEIRKRQTVSVAVAIEPELLIEQMLDRGVLPDLLPPMARNGVAGLAIDQAEKFLAQGSRQVIDPDSGSAGFVAWSLDRNPARWLPRLNACALAVLPEADLLRRRWLRLAPRYLGQLARREHGVPLSAEEKEQFKSGIESCVSQFTNEGEESPQISIF